MLCLCLLELSALFFLKDLQCMTEKSAFYNFLFFKIYKNKKCFLAFSH